MEKDKLYFILGLVIALLVVLLGLVGYGFFQLNERVTQNTNNINVIGNATQQIINALGGNQNAE